MSLKVEQRLENEQFTEFTPKIYTTGAHLVPMCVAVNGEGRYVWVVEEFDNASYFESESVSPLVYGASVSEILNLEEN